jgi:hypothetical protein
MAEINSPTPGRPTPSLVQEIKGKYSFVATSSDAFASRKQQEIELEDRLSARSGDLRYPR